MDSRNASKFAAIAVRRTLAGSDYLERCAKALKELRPKQLDAAEASMERAMRAFFREVAESVVSAMGAMSDELLLSGPSVAELLYREVDWTGDLQQAAGPELFSAAVAGYETAKALFEDRMADVRSVMPVTKIAEGGWDPSEGTFLEGWDLPVTVRDAIASGVSTTLAQPYWQKILETTGTQVQGTLLTAMEEQWNRGELKQQIMRDIGDETGVRSRRIARTEMTGSMNLGHTAQAFELEQDFGLHPIKIWVSVGDPFVRDTHVDADGQEVAGNEPFIVGGFEADYPGSWELPAEERVNCILPGNEVQGSFIAGSKAWYEGKAVEVVTASGRRLATTPQHPIMTEHGFVGAGSLQKGDKIVAYSGQVDLATGRCHDVDEAPVLIQDVFDSLRFRCDVSRAYVVEHRGTLPADFHGDGQRLKGQIEVVRPNWELAHSLDASFAKIPLHLQFGRVNSGLIVEPSEGPCNKIRRNVLRSYDRSGIGSAGSGLPSSGTLTNNGLPVLFQRFPFEPLRIGPAANWHIAISEAAKQKGAVVSSFVRELLKRFPGEIPFDDLVEFLDRPLPLAAAGCTFSSQGNTGLTEMITEDAPANTGVLRDGRQRLTSKVSLDEVVQVRDFAYRGHVYDLQSLSGLIIASIGDKVNSGGAILGNCRCTFFTDLAELRAGGFTSGGEATHGEEL